MAWLIRWHNKVSLYLAYALIVVVPGLRSAIPEFLPESTATTILTYGVDGLIILLWIVLLVQIVAHIFQLYGDDGYLQKNSPFRVMGDLALLYLLAIYCFAIWFSSIHRGVSGGAFNLSNGGQFDFLKAIYFSAVTMSTTGYGDITPTSSYAIIAVTAEIIFGYLYTLLLFSTVGGLAGRRNQAAAAQNPAAPGSS
jgi:hypothetical protein